MVVLRLRFSVAGSNTHCVSLWYGKSLLPGPAKERDGDTVDREVARAERASDLYLRYAIAMVVCRPKWKRCRVESSRVGCGAGSQQ